MMSYSNYEFGILAMGLRLKGIFWKPGVNGLGVFGFKGLPYRRRFNAPAVEHDVSYDIGGSVKDRYDADITLLYGMVLRCGNLWQVFMAMVYYFAVRLFGWAFFNYKC